MPWLGSPPGWGTSQTREKPSEGADRLPQPTFQMSLRTAAGGPQKRAFAKVDVRVFGFGWGHALAALGGAWLRGRLRLVWGKYE